VRQLLPVVVDGGGSDAPFDPLAACAADDRPPPPGRPWVLCNTATSADGATALDGVSAALCGAVDRAVFGAIRAVADVILVGAATVRAEDYGPARPSAAGQALRVARGQAPAPRIAVVSGTLSVDPAARLLAEAGPGEGPLVLTTAAAPADRRAALAAAGAEVLDVTAATDGTVDLLAALTVLRQRGAAVVLCEGGPTLTGQLVAADVVDEWCLTLGPVLVGGTSDRAAVGPPAGPPVGLRLVRLVTGDDGTCCLRYVRAPSAPD